MTLRSGAVRLMCDEMLLRLGRWLRAAGYDTAIAEGGTDDAALIARCAAEGRVLLTRDRLLAGRAEASVPVLLLVEETIDGQARALAARSASTGCAPRSPAASSTMPYSKPRRPRRRTRCRRARARRGGQAAALSRLCGRLYWPGGHVRRMRDRLASWAGEAAQAGCAPVPAIGKLAVQQGGRAMAIERMLSEEVPARVLVARVLAEAGIEYVFGISGGHTGRIVQGLSQVQNQVRMVTVREESLAGVMAEVYGRLTRRPGVMIGQGPWVLGNGLIGTLEAFLSGSPMLLLTDFSDAPRFTLHAPYQQATGDYGSWDARRAFGGVTKQVMQAQEPIAAVQATQLAIKHAMAGQPGPVAVLFGHDALAGSVAPDSQPVLYPTRYYLPPAPPPADPAQIAAAAERILAAERPVIVAGNGVRIAQAYEQLRDACRDRRDAGRDDRRRQGRASPRRIRWHWACSARSARRRRMPASARPIWSSSSARN